MTNCKLYNYSDLEITSSYTPQSNHKIIENETYGLYMLVTIAGTGYDAIVFSDDEGDSWDIVAGNSFGYYIHQIYHDKTNNLLYYWRYPNPVQHPGETNQLRYIDMSDNSDNLSVDTGLSISDDITDLFEYDGDLWMFLSYVWLLPEKTRLYLYNITDAVLESTQYDCAGANNSRSSRICIVGDMFFVLVDNDQDDEVRLYKYDVGDDVWTHLQTTDSNIRVPSGDNYRGISYDGSNFLYFILYDMTDSKHYLYTYDISGDTLTKRSEYNISLMLERNVHGTNLPFTLEKGFHVSEDKVYQIPSTYSGRLNFISNFNFSDTIIAITDHYVMDASGNMYKYIEWIAQNVILRAEMYHQRQDYSYMKLKYNSDLITIVPQMILQIIGSHTISGSTNTNQVIFEGIVQKPTKGRIQTALVVNQASEMDEVKAKGSKSGRTDQIISDINDDGAPNGPSYIHDGTLSSGTALGDKEVDGKKLRTIYDDYAENDGFTWALRPQGQFDYNNGAIDSGADLRFDGSTYTDTIIQLKSWDVAKNNQIIVNGAINPSTGEPYTGIWNDTKDQQINGINSITIEDASLDSNALCQSKADTLGANETEITRAEFKYKKATYGLIQPGQTITFKFVVPNYITISEAQFVVDYNMLELISEVGYMAISSAV